MSTINLDQPVTGPVIRGIVPISLPLPNPDSRISLVINAHGVRYAFDAPIAGSPIVEANRIVARFIVDDHVYLDLNLVGKSSEQKNQFKSGQFSLLYRIEEDRPRAQFVANTLMAAVGLSGKFDLRISEPEVSVSLSFELPLLDISKMLLRRQTAYRLMSIEELTGKQFLIPPAMSEKEIADIAFVYHAIVDHSFTWLGGNFDTSISATPANASGFAQLVQSFIWSLPVPSVSETLLGQPIHLGPATVTMEDAVVKNLDEVRLKLEPRDGRQVTFEIRSLTGQDTYEFTELAYPSGVIWDPKIQALVDLERSLDAALTARFHALAASTLEGLTDGEKAEITTPSKLGEAFHIDV
jgi:hypothetical protein